MQSRLNINNLLNQKANEASEIRNPDLVLEIIIISNNQQHQCQMILF